MKYCFGIDIGGTTVKMGLFQEDGELLDKWEIKTRTENQGEAILPDIAQAVKAKMAEKKLVKEQIIGLGMGLPAPVTEDGIVQNTANLGWGYKEVTRELEELLDRLPRQLSGGQAQRVAVGRAIVKKPDVFLFDEPLSNLDAALRVKMRIEIAKLHKELNSTIIYVTHDQVEAMTLADKIVVLSPLKDSAETNLEQYGSPLDLYHNPSNKFVAGFIGSPKMNFLPVKVTATAIDQVQVELPNRQQIWLPVDSHAVQVGANMSLGIRPEHLLPLTPDETSQTCDELTIG